MAIEKMNQNIFRTISIVNKYLDQGLTTERIKKRMGHSDGIIADLNTIYHTLDFQEFLARRSGTLESDSRRIGEVARRVWSAPHTFFRETNQDGGLYMFGEEHTSYICDMSHYLLAPLKTICRYYWTDYDPEISHDELLARIKKSMRYKGIKTARNLRIMHPQEGYAQYIRDYASQSNTRSVELSVDVIDFLWLIKI